MEATGCSETSVYNKPTWRYIPEDGIVRVLAGRIPGVVHIQQLTSAERTDSRVTCGQRILGSPVTRQVSP
jgi:hypothetical protein